MGRCNLKAEIPTLVFSLDHACTLYLSLFYLIYCGLGVRVLNKVFLGLGILVDGVCGLWCRHSVYFGFGAVYININTKNKPGNKNVRNFYL